MKSGGPAALALSLLLLPTGSIRAGDPSSPEESQAHQQALLDEIPRPWPKFEKSLPPGQPQETPPGPDPVFPEDGSLPMKAWYSSSLEKHKAYSGLKEILKAEGVQIKDIGFDYDWIQDVALFSATGTLLLMADMPADLEITGGLTFAVRGGDYGGSLARLTEDHAKRIGASFRQMAWTFVEGGEMVAGRFSNGETYAIVGKDVLERTKAFHKIQTKETLSDEKARELVAADLGIKPENLFPVKASGHLDLVMTALPEGKILLSDPSRTQEVLRTLLAKGPPASQKERLSSIADLYNHGFQRRYSRSAPPDIAGKPMGEPLWPADDREISELNEIASSLDKRFQIIRVAGVFKELERYSNSEDLYISDAINFFNGFAGSNARRELFVVTNGAQGLSPLEDYWREILSAQGVEVKHVYFPGRYRSGAGLDCAGAPSGN